MILVKQNIAVAFAIAQMLLAIACGKKSEATTAKRGARQPVFPVEVVRVEDHPHELVITAPGVVDAFEHVQVTARVSGVVEQSDICGRPGRQVRPGAIVHRQPPLCARGQHCTRRA